MRDGVLKVQVRKEDLEGCNYMRFINNMDIVSPKEPKIFYAFVDELRWVNNETTEIYYTIDIMQTYYFDYTLLESFVEREHSASDEFCEFHIEENISCGDYIRDKTVLELDYNPTYLLYLCNKIPEGYSDNYAEVIEGQAIGIPYYQSMAVGSILQRYLDEFDGGNWIDVIYQIPHIIYSEHTPTRGYYEIINSNGSTIVGSDPTVRRTYNVLPTNLLFGNYAPKNKKMYNYPYCYVLLTNFSGDNVILKPELFDSPYNAEFILMGCVTPSPSIQCIPNKYRGFDATVNNVQDVDESITLTNFPQVPFVGSTFKDFINRNGLAMGISAAVTVGSAAAGGALGISAAEGMLSVATGAQGIARGQVLVENARNRAFTNTGIAASNSISGIIGNLNNALMAPNQSKNLCTQANGIRCSHDLYKIGAYMYRITEDNAKIIDEYFTKYGYTCKETKFPNTSVRTRFNYTKTVSCNLRGNAPSNILEAVKAVFDNGVTFWKDYVNFCDYSIDNTIPSG